MSQFLVSEFTALSVEARRKHPEIKQAVDVALNELKSDPDRTLANCRLDSAPGQDHILLKPVLLCCETKHVKIITLAMAILQRIVLQKLVPNTAIVTIVPSLHKLLTPINRCDVDVQLKVLQIVSALLSSYPVIHNELLSQTLMLCFKLQDGAKVAVVSSTAAATLRQTIMVVFDKVKHEDEILDGIKGGGEDAAAKAPLASMSVDLPEASVTLFPSSKDAYMLFSDLCSLASGEHASFLTLTSLSKTFSLELIESVLTNHPRLFSMQRKASGVTSHPELLFILRSKVCPLLIKALSESSVFPTHLRLMRLLFLLLRQFSADLVVEAEILINILLRSVQLPFHEKKNPTVPSSVSVWQHVLSLEVVRSLCSDDLFLRNLWVWYDSNSSVDSSVDQQNARAGSTKVFAKLVETLHRVAIDGHSIFVREASMQIVSTAATPALSPSSPRKGRARDSMDRSYSGLYEAAAGAISGVLGSSDFTPTEMLNTSSSPAIQIIDQLDKTEPPAFASAALPKTYPQLLALQSILFLTQTMAGFALPLYSKFVNSRPAGSAPAPPAMSDSDVAQLTSPIDRHGLQATKAMLQCAAPVVCDTLVHYLGIKSADSIFQDILVALHNYTNTCGALSLMRERDAGITSIISFAVPSLESGATAGATEDGSLEVSNRNLACLRALIQVAYYLSGSLQDYWYTVLKGLCNAQEVLTNLLTATSSVKKQPDIQDGTADDSEHNQLGFATLSTLTHSSIAALDSRSGRSQLQLLNVTSLQPAQLQSQIQSIFENSAALDDDAFLSFVSALCQLSADLAGLHVDSTKSPSLLKSRYAKAEKHAYFPIACVGLVANLNIQRLVRLEADRGWSVIVDHLKTFSAAQHVPASWRVEAAQVANTLLLAALSQELGTNANDQRATIQRQAFETLSTLAILQHRRTSTTDIEIRRMSVETFMRILEAHGHSLLLGWEIIFEICSAACQPPKSMTTSSEALGSAQKALVGLVKIGFSCLQAISSDFLSTLTLQQLQLCISCLGDFGAQLEDVNVALTANGCLWGVTAEMAARGAESAAPANDEALANLWLFLLHRILSITRDARSDVRNGAISNLFRVLEQYGNTLDPDAWQNVTWEILFPLVKSLDATAREIEDNTQATSSEADDLKAQAMGLPQSEHKQWQESRALALCSLGEVVRDFIVSRLVECQEFPKIWQSLLAHIKSSFLVGPPSISQASIKTFSTVLSADPNSASSNQLKVILHQAWRQAWDTWTSIGQSIAKPINQNHGSEFDSDKSRCFTQKNLVAYIESFEPVHRIIASDVDSKSVELLLSCLKNCVAYLDSPDHSPDVDNMTEVQQAARRTLRSVVQVDGAPSLILFDLAESICFAFSVSAPEESTNVKSTGPSFVALAKSSISEALESFQRWESNVDIYVDGAFERLLAALMVPIKLKYDCPPASKFAKNVRPLWQSSTLAFCKIVRICCPSLNDKEAQLGSEKIASIWKSIIDVFVAALLADSSAVTQLSPEQYDSDERFGLFVLATIECHVLPYLGNKQVPSDLIREFGQALVAASLLYSVDGSKMPNSASGRLSMTQQGIGSTVDFTPLPNERLAYWCFDLAFLACSDRHEDHIESRKRLAALWLPMLLKRCERVLSSYVQDAELRGMSPLPRLREEELNYVLSHYLDLRLWRSGLACALSEDPSQTLEKYNQDSSISVTSDPGGLLIATRHSPRAHLFSAYHYLCDLVALRLPAGALPIQATIGTSLPNSVPLNILEQEFQTESLDLAIIGKTTNIFNSPRLDRIGGNHSSLQLARKSLTLVANELGLSLNPSPL